VNSDSLVPHSGPIFLHFKISFSFITAYVLMTIRNLPTIISELKEMSFLLIYVLADVHFLHLAS